MEVGVSRKVQLEDESTSAVNAKIRLSCFEIILEISTLSYSPFHFQTDNDNQLVVGDAAAAEHNNWDTDKSTADTITADSTKNAHGDSDH